MRTLLAVSVLLSALVSSLLPTTTQAFPLVPTLALTFDDLARLTQTYDQLYDQVEEFPQIRTTEDIYQWVREVLPYFSYEMITDPEKDLGDYNGTQAPTSIQFIDYEDERRHNHILGTADCIGGHITLNGRYANEISSFYDRDDLLVVLIHELAHVQGICYGSDRLDSEVSAQLVTLEIMAALINHENTLVVGPLLKELRNMSFDAALYAAYQEDRLEDFDALVTSVVNSTYERARIDKARRYWINDKERESYILYTYNYSPIVEIEKARTQPCSYFNIYWSVEQQEIIYEPISVDTPCVRGVLLPINQNVFDLPLFVDDLSYFLTHAEEFVNAL